MSNLNEYAKKIATISKSKKFPETSIEQKILGIYNGVSAFSNTVARDDKKETDRRFAAVLVNLMAVVNDLEIDLDASLSNRIQEIEECKGHCQKK